jgi:hypothetical protein
MTPRLGKNQIDALTRMSGALWMLVTPGPVHRGLVAKGLLRSSAYDTMCISPAGLRRVADLLEAGVIKDALTLAEERKRAKEITP